MNPIQVTWAPAKAIAKQGVTIMVVEAGGSNQVLVTLRGPKINKDQFVPEGLLGDLMPTSPQPRLFWLVRREEPVTGDQVWAYEVDLPF